MVKLAGCVIIIFCCSALGFLKAAEFEERAKILRRMKCDFEFFKNEISFMRTPMCEILKKAAKREGEIAFFYNNVCKNFENCTHESFSKLFCREAQMLEKSVPLTKGDIEILISLGQSLGKSDVDGQISAISAAEAAVDAQICEAEEVKSKNARLFKSLGIYAGILITIIFF